MSRPDALYEQIEAAMRKAWWPVARLADLDRPRLAILLGEELVVFRTVGGTVAVAFNRCPHRGARLAIGEVVGENIQCPYHGWEFAVDGSCARIPSLNPGEKIASNVLLKTYPVREYLGLVWTALEDPVADMPDPEELRHQRIEWEAGPPIPVHAGVVATTENFRDVAHFPFVHKATMGEIPPVVEPLKVRREGREVWLDRWYTASGGADIWESQAEIRFYYHTIAPGFVCLVFDYGERGKRYLVQACSPVGIEENVLYWVEGVGEDFVGPSLAECTQAEYQVFLEDMPILESLRPREVPFGQHIEVSAPADRYTLAVRRAFLEFVRSATDDRAEVEAAVAVVEGDAGAL